jgi:signal peptidase I
MSPSIAYARARCVEERFVASQDKESNPIAAKLRADGSVCFRVLGASMFPWIRSGDLVFVRSFAYEQASRGDVVCFERAGRLFVHRVIREAAGGAGGKEHGAMITKGDALDAEDEPVTRAEFLGRVIRVHRGDRHIDLGSIGRVIMGRLIAYFSRASFALYGPARFLKHLVFD